MAGRPSEGNPHFHQQMVYTVAMSTVERFEQALGRPLFWRPKPNDTLQAPTESAAACSEPGERLYSPAEVALLFGYVDADADDPREELPGDRIDSCLSPDIIAHETTHAILDGKQRH
jgi:hypothetical protein